MYENPVDYTTDEAGLGWFIVRSGASPRLFQAAHVVSILDDNSGEPERAGRCYVFLSDRRSPKGVTCFDTSIADFVDAIEGPEGEA